MRQAESPPFAVPPAYAAFFAFGSAVQVTMVCVSRSHQALVTIPWLIGSAPVETVAWPTHVSGGAEGWGGWGWAELRTPAPSSPSLLTPPLHCPRNLST